VTGADVGRSGLEEALVALRCPLCARSLKQQPSLTLRCESGHAFDVARHGYVNFAVEPATRTRRPAASVLTL
jgi:hypothetical protein